MDFWGFLYKELTLAAIDMMREDMRVWHELNELATRAGWVFEDWKDSHATDKLVLSSRKAYGKYKRQDISDQTREIVDECEKTARREMVAHLN